METPSVDQPTVLIISNDAEFSRVIAARWKSEGNVPAFSVMTADLCPGLNSENFDVAIVGGLPPNAWPSVIATLQTCGKPVLLVRNADKPQAQPGNAHSRLMTLFQKDDDWPDAAVLILSECLRNTQAAATIQRLEHKSASMTRDAALGRYILEMRHSLNNALTSVLGNSELLVLEPETLAPLDARARSQIETIRNMALRIHEILQRFSSLEKELNVAEKQAANESKANAQAAGTSL
ncbi:MAG: hypothetical protein ACHP8A_08825 [Terriglobales bacterium]|jgi:signal transduction histidine kinase|nr:hypothetical protein [Terriglobales bacterium]